MNDNQAFLEKWKGLNIRNQKGMEWSLFVPPGAKSRTQRQFNLYQYYRFIHSLCVGKNYKNAVELGCGRGTIGLYLNKYDGLAVTLTDIEKEALELACQNFDFFGGQAAYLVADAQDTKLPASSFDLVVSIGLLEHISEYRRVLAESYRILKPGGMMVTLNIPGKWSVQKFNEVYKRLVQWLVPVKKKDYYRNSDRPEQYLAAAEAVGFKQCFTMNVNPFPIWTPVPVWLEYPIALCYRFILWIRGWFMKEPMKTNYLFSQGHFLVGRK